MLENGTLAVDKWGNIPVVVLGNTNKEDEYLLQRLDGGGQYKNTKDKLIIVNDLNALIKYLSS